MKKLQESLGMSPKQLKEQRVTNFCENLKSDAEYLIEQKKRLVRDMQDKLDTLLDLGEDNTISIAQKLKNVDTKELIKETFELSYSIKEETRILESMKNDYKELFGE